VRAAFAGLFHDDVEERWSSRQGVARVMQTA
jgi:hypothetical protein